jgi:superfamily II DNA or RNA helicase
MPTIFDNIDTPLLPALRDALAGGATGLDVCVGYFNLRGWQSISDLVEHFPGTDNGCCRLIVGMQRPAHDLMKQAQRLPREEYLDGPTLARLHREIATSFREQLEFGLPTALAEHTLRQLAHHLRTRKLRVRLFLAHPLHAKLYLVQRTDPIVPRLAYLGSSNLTLPGLSQQGELNVDVTDGDATAKLQRWFDDRWNDYLCHDISDELATLIEQSWARETLVKPYHVYLKMAAYLCQEAREGEREFPIPSILDGVLLDFQARAVSLVAHKLYRSGGVLLGDVVGLGKTLMATTVARIFQEDDHSTTLVICPPKLVSMWEWHLAHYGIAGKVLSVGKVSAGMETRLPRFRLVIVDESHNLRNRESKRYLAIRDYIAHNEARVLLLTATPYNKHFTDLSNQLRLFLNDQRDLRVRPEGFFRQWYAQGFNDADFIARFQASPGSLRAFDQSDHPEDWRDLMRLFMVRRTRQFLMRNYATFDEQHQRYFVTINGARAYIPLRQPRTLPFALNEDDPGDQYAQLYRDDVVQVIEELDLPRYGLTRYLNQQAVKRANPAERVVIDNLNRAGRRLIGFCRTGLFKRLESSGWSFLLSLERHIIRNLVTLYALEQGVPVPIGTQDVAMLDTAVSDEDSETVSEMAGYNNAADAVVLEDKAMSQPVPQMETYRARAAAIYQTYQTQFQRRFTWLDSCFFVASLKKDLQRDTERLLTVFQRVRNWTIARDTKLSTLVALLTKTHPYDKVLIFTQFADTANYLASHLHAEGIAHLGLATGDSANPTTLARRFSPRSNGGLLPGESELRILIATDVLGEGQNLQDAHIVVNYDLPWAIIRLIQRVGRVDRIGQRADTIYTYSFMPAEGVEKIINLRARLYQRLQQNQEVIGTDESFFGEDAANQLYQLYTENAQVLNDDGGDEDVDLSSVALQVWNSASEADRKAAMSLPPVISATRAITATARVDEPAGAITYLRFPDGTDALVRVDDHGTLVSQSITSVFRAAACGPDVAALPCSDTHYTLVETAVRLAVQEQVSFGGQLGSLRSVRRQVYERLKRVREQHQQRPTLFSASLLEQLAPVVDMVRRYPLKEAARSSLRRQIQLGIPDEHLVEMVQTMYTEDRLCIITEETNTEPEPQIVCSLGMVLPESGNS